MRFGISTFLYREQPLTHQHLVDVAASGFESVELYAARPHANPDDPDAGLRLKDWLDATSLALHAVNVPLGVGLSLATSDAGRRARAVREVERVLTMARVIPPTCLVVRLGATGDTDVDPKAARRSLQAVLLQTAEVGVRVAVEVLANRLTAPAALVRMLEEEVDLRPAGICLDFGYRGGPVSLVETIEVVGGHLVATHVHDVDGRGRRHLVPFAGHVDWATTLMTLQKIGYDDTLTFVLEAAGDARGVLRRAAQARDRLRHLLI